MSHMISEFLACLITDISPSTPVRGGSHAISVRLSICMSSVDFPTPCMPATITRNSRLLGTCSRPGDTAAEVVSSRVAVSWTDTGAGEDKWD
jgi:hypothetical protein